MWRILGLLRLRRVEHMQIPDRQEPLEPGIRGPLDRRHATTAPRPAALIAATVVFAGVALKAAFAE